MESAKYRHDDRIVGVMIGSVLIAVALLIVNLMRFDSVADDAYIAFRYLDNWLEGAGLVFNPGEQVEGYSSLLWIVLLFPLRAVGLAPERASMVLSCISLLVILVAVYRASSRIAGSPVAGVTALVLTGGSVPLAVWATSGMETVCVAALLALAARQLSRDRWPSAQSGLLLGAVALARPEGVGFALIVLLFAITHGLCSRRADWRPLGVFALLSLGLAAGQLVLRYWYYQAWLPNTYFAKLTGDIPSLWPLGFRYVIGYLEEGGLVILGLAVLALRPRLLRNWVTQVLSAWILFQFFFAIRVGGDYFPFHRFLVPVVPVLAILAGSGWALVVRSLGTPFAKTGAMMVPVVLVMMQIALAWTSPSSRAFSRLEDYRGQLETVAKWAQETFPPDSLLAVNAAGIIPYRTGMPTVDMLGLNDAHIARAGGYASSLGGASKVGHMKSDGRYVCSRAPDVVLFSDGGLQSGRSAQEAVLQVSFNNYRGDREFLQAPDCTGRYRPLTKRVGDDGFIVVYVRTTDAGGATASPVVPRDEPGRWFELGLELMASSRLEEAAEEFERVLRVEPANPAALTNLGYCRLDLGDPARAAKTFEQVLEVRDDHHEALFGLALSYQKLGQQQVAIDLWRRYLAEAPDSIWKRRARENLELLGGSG